MADQSYCFRHHISESQSVLQAQVISYKNCNRPLKATITTAIIIKLQFLFQTGPLKQKLHQHTLSTTQKRLYVSMAALQMK